MKILPIWQNTDVNIKTINENKYIIKITDRVIKCWKGKGEGQRVRMRLEADENET